MKALIVRLVIISAILLLANGYLKNELKKRDAVNLVAVKRLLTLDD